MCEGRKLKTTKTEKTIFYIVLVTMAASFIYAFVHIFTAPNQYNDNVSLIKSDYILMTLQALGGLVLLFLPMMIEKKWKVDIPSGMNIFLIIFLYAAIILGEFRRFYFYVPGWDKMLHTISGAFLAALSFSVISMLNGYDIIKMNPFLVAIFTFCFAMTLGILWELYEYIWDTFANLNMQKYADAQGVPFVGKEALKDTMGDVIVDGIGAMTMSIIGFFAVKYDKPWINYFVIKKVSNQELDDVKALG